MGIGRGVLIDSRYLSEGFRGIYIDILLGVSTPPLAVAITILLFKIY
jgi:hypothetical protein